MITGVHPHEMYSISKMMWLKKNRPEIYEKAAYIFLVGDFVVYHLTGKRQMDYSLATRTMAFDIRKLAWSEKILETAGIMAEKMSAVVPTGTDAGVITDAAARRTGLQLSTHIITVSHDQVAAAVGAGAFDSSVAVDGAGTVGCAMLTGIAIGIFNGLEDAVAHMVEEVREYHPRKEMHEKYAEIFERYKKVYQAVRPLV